MNPKIQPTLSQRNTLFIDNILQNNPIDLVIEYGSGLSTFYYINQLRNRKCRFVSVENSKHWFFNNIRLLKEYNVRDEKLERKFWAKRDYQTFLNGQREPYTPIVDGYSRYNLWVKKLQYGPFVRLQRKLRFLSPVFKVVTLLLRRFPYYAEERSSFTCKIGEMDFGYELITPQMKDQYGESPTREEYAQAGTKEIASGKYKNILVLIDGGARHHIVDQIYSAAGNAIIHLCLFDAWRPEYTPILSKRDGKFHKANTILLDGTKFYKTNQLHRLRAELWYDVINKPSRLFSQDGS